MLLAMYWIVYSLWRWTEIGASFGFMGFLIMLAVMGVVILLFASWWLAASRVGWREKLLVLGAGLVVGVLTRLLLDDTVGPFWLIPGLALVLTTGTVAFVLLRKCTPPVRSLALVGSLCVSWAAFVVIRADGMDGEGRFALHWRWSLTPEQVYLAELEARGGTAAPQAAAPKLKLRPGDWPTFRGPRRDAILPGVRIATDWDVTPPGLVWKRRIGPAWSSIIFVDGRLFTQEQMGPHESVTCIDAATGETVWSHQDLARHEDVQARIGPRATPTFADGRIFALGATGILNCLDAATGERKWSRDIGSDIGARVPMWGFSSSPLVHDKGVIVFAGGNGENTLLAYDAESGEPAWTAPAGNTSYSSPQLARLGGETRLLFVSDHGLSAFDLSSGAHLWTHPTPAGNPGVPRAVQPHPIGPNRALFDAGPDLGTALIEFTADKGAWKTKEVWLSRVLKPSFNDFVVLGSAIYGFDGRTLTCVDLETGKRRWKEGRYGNGQVLLLADQPLLVVVSDEGEVILVSPDPDEHRELARFPAIKGKTWNHPAIAHGRLYLRNAQEIACYELRLAEPR
jgi:outer membrane protein assembly factor BamB